MTECVFEDDLFLIFSPGGRVLFCARSLKDECGQDLTGRNLTDFLPDRIAADMIRSDSDAYFGAVPALGAVWTVEVEQEDDGSVAVFRRISDGMSERTMLFDCLDRAGALIGEGLSHRGSEKKTFLKMLRLYRTVCELSLWTDGKLPFSPEMTDLSALCREVSASALELTGKGRAGEIEDGVFSPADPYYLRRAICAMWGMACRGEPSLTLKRKGKRIYIGVRADKTEQCEPEMSYLRAVAALHRGVLLSEEGFCLVLSGELKEAPSPAPVRDCGPDETEMEFSPWSN